jgi:hypothetical protein
MSCFCLDIVLQKSITALKDAPMPRKKKNIDEQLQETLKTAEDDLEQENNGDGEYDDSQEEDENDLWEVKIRSWIEQTDLEGLGYIVNLYKKREGFKNWPFVNQWKNKVPDSNEIGLEHGGGIYRMWVTLNLNKGETPRSPFIKRQFTIDESYDRRHLEYMQEKRRQIVQTAQQQQSQNMGGSHDLRHIIRQEIKQALDQARAPHMPQQSFTDALLLKMVEVLGNQKQAQPDISNLIGSLWNSANMATTKVFEEALAFRRRAMEDAQKEIESRLYEGETEETQETVEAQSPPRTVKEAGESIILGLLAKYKPIIEQKISEILSGGEAAEKAVGFIKNLPMFQATLDNKKELKTLVSWIETQFGREKTELVLRQIGVQRPDSTAEKNSPILAMVWPFLDPYLTRIAAGNGESPQLVEHIKGSDFYRALIKDKAETLTFAQAVKERYGTDQANKIFQNLGLV